MAETLGELRFIVDGAPFESEVEFWRWLAGYLVTASTFSALAVFTEKGDRTFSQRQYAKWLLPFGLYWLILFAVPWGKLVEASDSFWLNLGVIIFAINVPVVFYHYRIVVGRARDAGFSKLIPYLAVLPVMAYAIPIFLLFKGSENSEGLSR